MAFFAIKPANYRALAVIACVAIWALVRVAVWDHLGRGDPLWPDVLGPVLALGGLGFGAVWASVRVFPPKPAAPYILTENRVIAPNGSTLVLAGIKQIKPLRRGLRLECARFADGMTIRHLSDPLATARAIIAQMRHLHLPE